MTPLREAMIKAMQMRGFSARTHQSYLAAVTDLARRTKCPPERLSAAEINGYFQYLVTERGLAPASCRLFFNGIRFLYVQVLDWPDSALTIALPRLPQRIPQLLTRAEVAGILCACAQPKYRMMLTLCYGCGLRVSELLAVKVSDLDGERRLLRVEQGKGAKDRLVPISETLLEQLRVYWRSFRPAQWLFPGAVPGQPLCATSVQKVYTRSKGQAGVSKIGGIHALRHAYATHSLEAGMPIHRLQQLMGHRNLQSTERYVHWVPAYREGEGDADLIAKLGVDHG
ncbi:MAG: tyrosine-type recombinase/integrase [Sulfitobacter sp.]|nr:tyrosine-type recombinase/integrase [Sulfitobacter sp.]